MTKSLSQKFLVIASIALMAGACAQNHGSLEAAGSGSTETGSNGNNSGQKDPATQPKPDVDMNGFVDGGQYAQKQTMSFDKQTKELVISLPLGMDGSLVTVNGTIPSLPGVTFYTSHGSDGTSHLVLRVPVKYFMRGINTIPVDRLPNGSPLPNMPTGEAPAVGFEINPNSGKKAYLYLGVEAVGLYVESKLLSCQGLPICLDMQFPIRNTTKTKILGYFSLLMPRNGSMGGFFISTVIPPDIARILDQYL